MKDSIFTKIIKGETPCHKIYEDDVVFAFLDIMPDEEGHTLLVPRVQIDKIYDLDDEIYQHLWRVARQIARHYEQVTGFRVMFHVVGVDVPHAHIHIIPRDPNNHLKHDLKVSAKIRAEDSELMRVAEKLKIGQQAHPEQIPPKDIYKGHLEDSLLTGEKKCEYCT